MKAIFWACDKDTRTRVTVAISEIRRVIIKRILGLGLTLVFFTGLRAVVYAQDAGQRTHDMLAALDKTKYKKKEKKGFSVEVYVDVKNEPVLKRNPSEYWGTYKDDDGGYQMTLRVAADGSVQGSGFGSYNAESSDKAKFTLKDARVEGALLSGIKVYENGETKKFEAIFTNRTVSSGANAASITSRDTTYGLGF